MPSIADRRYFLQTVIGGIAGVTLSQLAGAPARAAAHAPNIRSVKINDEVTMFTGAGANVVSLRGADGLLLVDGGLAEHSRDLLTTVFKETAARRVQILLNTHWHPEQTGSNERLGKDGVRIIAHENTKLWLGYQNELPWQHRTYGPLPPKARPNDTTYSSGRLQFGNQSVEYAYLLQAHTDGDLYVRFPEANVLVTGGPVSGDGWPVIDWWSGGWIGGLVDGLKTLVALADADTRVIPANGPVLGRKDLEAQRDMYATIFDRLGKLLRKGLAPEEVIAAAPTKEFDAQWGDSTTFVTMAFKSMWGHFAPDA